MQEKKPDRIIYHNLSDEMIEQILVDIEKGVPSQYAAEASGISEIEFKRVYYQGVADFKKGLRDTKEAKFLVRLRNMQKKEIIECINLIKDAPKGHKGAQWILEHVYWEHFGNNAQAIQLAAMIRHDREEGLI